MDPELARQQAERLAVLRSSRSAAEVDRALGALRSAAEQRGREHNVLYPLRAALAAGATVGEVCHALRDVWGNYTPSDAF
jgi:methylmalonyl-CoA mutase N-terminal domain/subunit